jgi:putative membrane protein
VTGVFLDEQAETAIRQRVAVLERATGVEVVAAVIARADSYPEIPWKAFALGVSLAALAAVAAALFDPSWEAAGAMVETAVTVLAAGAAAALATVWIAPWARLFLAQSRREAEVSQYAQAMFLESGMLGTTQRNGILLLVSLFEHQVVVVADPGARDKLGVAGLDPVVSAVTARLTQGTLKDALLDGLAQLEQALATRGFRAQPGDVNEVADSVIQRRGPS